MDEQVLVVCDSCANDEVPEDEISTDDAGTTACDACVQTLSTCNRCYQWEHNDSIHYIDSGGDVVCRSCFEDHYMRCENCGWTLRYDTYTHPYCTDCHYDLNEDDSYFDNINEWGDTPELRFTSLFAEDRSLPLDGKYYFGVEIEIEEGKQAVNDSINSFPRLWATTDSSLNNGVEVISNPGTLEAWNTGMMIDWDRWNRDIHNVVPNQRHFDTNGIHVHVSREAFNNEKGKQSASHVYKFMQFMQKHYEAMQSLAARQSTDYCDWNQSRDMQSRLREAKTKGGVYDVQRYRPINTQNNATIEIRMFDGRTDKDFIMRSIQLVHAIVEYTRHSPRSKLGNWMDFDFFVFKHATRYKELAAYMLEHKNALIDMTARSIPTHKRNLRFMREKKRRDAKAEAERRETRRIAQADPTQFISDCSCSSCRSYNDYNDRNRREA